MRTFTGGSLSPPHSASKPKKHSAKANAWSNPSPTPESSLLVPRGASEEDLAEFDTNADGKVSAAELTEHIAKHLGPWQAAFVPVAAANESVRDLTGLGAEGQ